MTILVNGQKITTAKVCIMPDVFDTDIIMEDDAGGGIFSQSKCNSHTIITIHENIVGWGDLSFKENK